MELTYGTNCDHLRIPSSGTVSMELTYGTNHDHLRYPGLAVLRRRHPQPGHHCLQELLYGGALASSGSGGFPSLGGDILVGLDTLLNLLVDIYLVLSELLSGFLSPLDPF